MATSLVTAGLVGAGLAPAGAATGSAPTVAVGSDQTVTLADTAFLPGKISDDGLPDPSALQVTWSKVSGPGNVTFGAAGEAHTSADFSAIGTYVLRLTVSDGGGSGSDDLTVTVRGSHATTIRVPADYPTITEALKAAPANALVLVSPGTYREPTLYVPRTLTLASTFYTTGDTSMINETVISNPSAETETVIVSSASGPDTRIVGFTVRDGKDGIKVRGAAVIEHNLLTNLATDAVDFPRDTTGLVQHNTMEHNGDDAVDVNESSPVIVDNLMRNNAGDGVEIRVTNMVAPVDEVIIRGNDILDNTQDGVQIIDDDAITATPAESATLFTLDRNVIAGNVQAGLGLMDAGDTSEDYRAASLVERITVTNNTFDGNEYGISGGDNLVAVNNVFARHPGLALKNVDARSQTAHNLFHENGGVYSGSNLDAATSFNGDPMLDSSFAPVSGSPVIDAGTASYTLSSGEQAVVVSDFGGSAPDIGAVESGLTRTNRAPTVSAGADLAVTLPATAGLSGTVDDDGLPSTQVTTTWSKVSGPGTVTFADPGAEATTAAFSAAGSYVLQLSADDGAASGSDTVTVTVSAAATGGDTGGGTGGGTGGDTGGGTGGGTVGGGTVGGGGGSTPSPTPTPQPTPEEPVAGPPDMPTAVSAVSGNASARVSWSAPRDNGSTITGYTVTASPGGRSVTVDGDLTAATVTGLTNGVGYTFTVVATNAVGTSLVSFASNRVTPATRPEQVRRPKVRVVGQRVIVSWVAPGNGGSAITRYRVMNGKGKVVMVPGSARRVVFRGLAPARYAFRVVAVNRVGRSPRSLPTIVRIQRPV